MVGSTKRFVCGDCHIIQLPSYSNSSPGNPSGCGSVVDDKCSTEYRKQRLKRTANYSSRRPARPYREAHHTSCSFRARSTAAHRCLFFPFSFLCLSPPFRVPGTSNPKGLRKIKIQRIHLPSVTHGDFQGAYL